MTLDRLALALILGFLLGTPGVPLQATLLIGFGLLVILVSVLHDLDDDDDDLLAT